MLLLQLLMVVDCDRGGNGLNVVIGLILVVRVVQMIKYVMMVAFVAIDVVGLLTQQIDSCWVESVGSQLVL